jgi:hypothetical protein
LAAIKASYPGLLARPRLEDGDWHFDVRGEPFVWANGRLLPEGAATKWMNFAPQPFYQYPAADPAVAAWSREQELAVEAQLTDRKATKVLRSGAFFDELWRIRNRAQADARQSRLKLFGLPVTMHQDVVPSLVRVEAALRALTNTDASVAKFLAGLKRLEGYNWRDIAGTQSRSNHAYGTAIDLIPQTYGGRAVYWLWAIPDTQHWYKWTWERRWVPPSAVVKAFEAEGWVWGGKWVLFDTIHFEYRPEILVLGGLR